MTDAPVLTVTLNPALDVTTTTMRLRPQQKLRCVEPRYDAGGGGVNVSRALRELGGDSRAFVALGGANGAHLEQLLSDTGIDHVIHRLAGETRVSMTVMEAETGLHYRFVLPGPHQSAAEADRLLETLDGLLDRHYAFVVASGSLPPGLPADFYARLNRLARIKGSALVLDTSGPPLAAALSERPYLVKLNHLEAVELTGGDPLDPHSAETVSRLVAERFADRAIVTLGDQGAYVATGAGAVHIRPPHVEVRSAVGAGDSFVAALMLGLVRGWPLKRAAQFGVAAAASAVTTEATMLCQRGQTERLFSAIAAADAATA